MGLGCGLCNLLLVLVFLGFGASRSAATWGVYTQGHAQAHPCGALPQTPVCEGPCAYTPHIPAQLNGFLLDDTSTVSGDVGYLPSETVSRQDVGARACHGWP